jgi:hypothetical protein
MNLNPILEARSTPSMENARSKDTDCRWGEPSHGQKWFSQTSCGFPAKTWNSPKFRCLQSRNQLHQLSTGPLLEHSVYCMSSKVCQPFSTCFGHCGGPSREQVSGWKRVWNTIQGTKENHRSWLVSSIFSNNHPFVSHFSNLFLVKLVKSHY